MIDSIVNNIFIWAGIIFCISQSAMFSGLNLALLGISRMRLEVEVASGDENAEKILKLRKDSNYLLTTILWGNVGINVLLTLLADSVLAGVTAFFFSTFLITFLGEITPQAYFSRHALKMGGLLAPVIRFYQLLLFPVAKPTAIMLDMWLGKEGIHYYDEHDLRMVIKKHIASSATEIDRIEGIGALNFLALDDIVISMEGQPINPASIIQLEFDDEMPVFPAIRKEITDTFLQELNRSGKKWIIIANIQNEPKLVMNANSFIRAVLLGIEEPQPLAHCHRPVMVTDSSIKLGKILSQLKVDAENSSDSVIDNDLILVWSKNDKRVITGADILGRLMYGIASRIDRPVAVPIGGHPQ